MVKAASERESFQKIRDGKYNRVIGSEEWDFNVEGEPEKSFIEIED